MSNDWNCVWATTGRLLGISASAVAQLCGLPEPVAYPGGFAADLAEAFGRMYTNSGYDIVLRYISNPSRQDIQARQRPGLATGITGPYANRNGWHHAVVMETRRGDGGAIRYYDFQYDHRGVIAERPDAIEFMWWVELGNEEYNIEEEEDRRDARNDEYNFQRQFDLDDVDDDED